MAHDEPLPEPKTPMWLPALGAALFLGGAVWWLSRTPDAPPAESATTTTAASASAAPSAAPPSRPAAIGSGQVIRLPH